MIQKKIKPVGKEIFHVSDQESYEIYLEDFEAASNNFGLKIFLQGNEASVKVVGRVSVKEKFIKKWNIEIIFEGMNQTASLDLRGVGEGSGTISFDGSAILEKKSCEATVEVSEKIMLLESAKGNCLPVLKVKTDQVKSASHSASVSPMGDEVLLFCKSRGIEGQKLFNLLKVGFLGKR